MSTPVPTAETRNLTEKFQAWEAAVNSQVFERRREVKGMVVAVLARAHHLQIGSPGTAKSYLVTTGMSYLADAKFMDILLHGYSVIEDMYGPISLKALDEDRYLRKTEGYVPTVDFVFADEVFRGNPALLNTNLWAFNERKFRNDAQVFQIPLISAFFAANTGPEDPSLQAFDDRIHLRYKVGPLKEAAARSDMFRMRLKRASQPKPKPILTIEDIRRANELVATVYIPDSVLEALNDLYDELGTVQVVPTDRKMADSLQLIQATAFRAGRMSATIDDLGILSDVFWTDFKDIPAVQEKVMELARPIDKEAGVLAGGVEDLANQVEQIIVIESKPIRVRKSVQLHTKIEDANGEIKKLRARALEEGTPSEVADEALRRLHAITRQLLLKGFRVKSQDGKLDKEELLRMIKEIRDEDNG